MHAGFLSFVLSTYRFSSQARCGTEPSEVPRPGCHEHGVAKRSSALYISSECIGLLSSTAAQIVYNVATEMVAMSSSVEKLVDHLTFEKAGFSCLRAYTALLAVLSVSRSLL